MWLLVAGETLIEASRLVIKKYTINIWHISSKKMRNQTSLKSSKCKFRSNQTLKLVTTKFNFAIDSQGNLFFLSLIDIPRILSQCFPRPAKMQWKEQWITDTYEACLKCRFLAQFQMASEDTEGLRKSAWLIKGFFSLPFPPPFLWLVHCLVFWERVERSSPS